MIAMAKDMPLVLYHATAFPAVWAAVATVSPRTDLNDCSMVEWHGRWYVFCGVYHAPGLYCRQVLYLSSGGDVRGPYSTHPASRPFLAIGGSKLQFGRNAGRIVPWGPYLLRPTQRYGRGTSPYGPHVHMAVIRSLSPTEFKEVYHPWWVVAASQYLCGSRAGAEQLWNGFGAHHIDLHPDGTGGGGWLAVTDGREAAGVTAARVHHRCTREYLAHRGASGGGGGGTGAAGHDPSDAAWTPTPECGQWLAHAGTFQAEMEAQRGVTYRVAEAARVAARREAEAEEERLALYSGAAARRGAGVGGGGGGGGVAAVAAVAVGVVAAVVGRTRRVAGWW